VGRLQTIIDRNRTAQRRGLRKLIITVGVMVLLTVIIVAMVTTDFAKPPAPKREPRTHVDGIYIGTPTAK
jgi:hypothetical protein